jgi:hypothetical protein
MAHVRETDSFSSDRYLAMPSGFNNTLFGKANPVEERKRSKFDGGLNAQIESLRGVPFNFSTSDHTGQGESANAIHSYQLCVAPYILRPENTRNSWTATLPPGRFVFVHSANKNETGYANFSEMAYMLTPAQLNYQLHLLMQDRMEKVFANPGFDHFTQQMREAYDEVMEEARNWYPIGVTMTKQDFAFKPERINDDRVITVQMGGNTFVDNYWGTYMTPACSLWFRLVGKWVDGKQSKIYKFGKAECGVVGPSKFGYMVPCVDCFVSFRGNSIPPTTRHYEYWKHDDHGKKERNDTDYCLAYLIKVGYCVEQPKGAEQRSRTQDCQPISISNDPEPGMLNQVFVLMTG